MIEVTKDVNGDRWMIIEGERYYSWKTMKAPGNFDKCCDKQDPEYARTQTDMGWFISSVCVNCRKTQNKFRGQYTILKSLFTKNEIIDMHWTPHKMTKDMPCEVCSSVGVVLHSYAPKSIFGEESELHHSAYLCKACSDDYNKRMGFDG